jgi:hypothetical protein
MRREPTDGGWVWAPNIDYWLGINRAQGTIPEAYRGMNRNDIVRSVGGTLWNRAPALEWRHDPSVRHTHGVRDNGLRYREIHTPLGMVYEESAPTESEHSAWICVKHLIEGPEDLRVMAYAVEASQPVADFGAARLAMDETADDGIVLHQTCCVPFIQFAKNDAGYMNAFYLLADYPDETERLVSAYRKKYVEAYALLSASPADVIAAGDNMDELMISPSLFERYAADFYLECKEAIGDKLLEVHWCGRTKNLLRLLPKTGVDVVEAVVTEPMDAITVEGALEALDGKVALQAGIPSVMVCPASVPQRDFEDYLNDLLAKYKGRTGFILGMADNVPPNADFARVELIGRLFGY